MTELTELELRAAAAAAEGLDGEVIAALLGTTLAAVKSSLGSAREKTGATNSAHLVCLLLRDGRLRHGTGGQVQVAADEWAACPAGFLLLGRAS